MRIRSRNAIDNYKVIEELGQSCFSSVYKVMNKKNNQYYVLKKILIDKKNESQFLETKKEVKIISSINNEYIVKYYEPFIEDNKYFNVIMEYCEYSNLRKFINKKKEENKLIDQM